MVMNQPLFYVQVSTDPIWLDKDMRARKSQIESLAKIARKGNVNAQQALRLVCWTHATAQDILENDTLLAEQKVNILEGELINRKE